MWGTGSKRLHVMRGSIDAIRETLDHQDRRIDEIERTRHAEHAATMVRLDQISALLDASAHMATQLSERLDALEARIVDADRLAARSAETFDAERSRRDALEQTIVKLEKRADAQADEARTTATALLQRMEAMTQRMPARDEKIDQAIAR